MQTWYNRPITLLVLTAVIGRRLERRDSGSR